jgi:hypothetical protein
LRLVLVICFSLLCVLIQAQEHSEATAKASGLVKESEDSLRRCDEALVVLASADTGTKEHTSAGSSFLAQVQEAQAAFDRALAAVNNEVIVAISTASSALTALKGCCSLFPCAGALGDRGNQRRVCRTCFAGAWQFCTSET